MCLIRFQTQEMRTSPKPLAVGAAPSLEYFAIRPVSLRDCVPNYLELEAAAHVG
jgi:hypothetical protein